MPTTDAYQTIAQEVYWGTDKLLAVVSPVITSVPIPSQLSARSRPVLGSTFPRITPARVDYRANFPQMLTGEVSDVLVANPEAIFVLVQTDALTGMAMQAAVAGIPEAAAQAGEIISNVAVQPRGPVHRCVAAALDAAGAVVNVAVGERAYVVVTKGAAGNVTRGVTASSAANPAILDMGTGGPTVTYPAGLQGWIVHGPALEIGA